MKKFSTKHYYKPTPVVWRKVGDTILIAATSLSAMILPLPIKEDSKSWIVFGVNLVGVAGKIVSNMFKSEDWTEPNL